MPEVVIEQISPASTWFIRHTVLWPDKPFSFVQLPEDASGYHWGLYANHELVSVVSLFLDGRIARFRKFATLPDFQNKGFGSMLLTHVFEAAKELGATEIWCDARSSAADFYTRFGMEVEGELFLKSEIAYFRMKKNF